MRGGWNLTGDTCTRDADGYLWYHARSDDMIVSAGYNIGAPEVEAVLDRHPDVAECAVVVGARYPGRRPQNRLPPTPVRLRCVSP
ncbi:acyl-CoA synthetase/AMP-acid ligase [Mycobacteroides abscessus subsp. abscessus]|nr:acyl-CoA synthetase/AMP-acid ligase [Mycobacteroides abscessus subsp. abscessus]